MPVFRPFDNTSSTVSVTASSSRIALADPGTEFRIINAGSEYVFFALGDDTVTATTGSVALPPTNSPEPFRYDDATHIALISASGTQTVYLTVGDGE